MMQYIAFAIYRDTKRSSLVVTNTLPDVIHIAVLNNTASLFHILKSIYSLSFPWSLKQVGFIMNLTPYHFLLDLILINFIHLMQINNTGNIQAWFWPPVGYCCLARLKDLKIIINKYYLYSKMKYKVIILKIFDNKFTSELLS